MVIIALYDFSLPLQLFCILPSINYLLFLYKFLLTNIFFCSFHRYQIPVFKDEVTNVKQLFKAYISLSI